MTGARLAIDLGPLRRSRDLRLLFIGGGISFAGTMLSFVAVPYQAYRISHSSLVVGLLSLAELAAMLLTAMVGGALADAADRRRMLRWTEAGLALGSAALLANALVGGRLWVLFLVAFLQAGLDGLQRPSLDALVPRLVPVEDMAATSAVMSLRSQIGMVAVPALAGLLLSAIGVGGAYAIDVATFAVSLFCLWRLGATPPPAEDAELSVRAVMEGLRYAVRRRDLLGSYVVDINAMFFGMPNALFPQLAARMGGASVLGVLYAAPAAGSLLVTLASGGWSRRVSRQGLMIAIAAAVWGAGIIALGFAGALWEAALALVVAGGADMMSGLGRMTMWNESVPDAIRGRLAGIEFLSYSTGPTLGNVESGVVESLAGLRASIVSGGVLCVIGTAAVALALPAFRRYRSEEGRAHRGPISPTGAGLAGTAPPLPGFRVPPTP
ncbi:MAG TPA: MFS transporter [Acidimicrobiales bacterium]|nr:MFS transporter [Acidimicrobiales bacterium]